MPFSFTNSLTTLRFVSSHYRQQHQCLVISQFTTTLSFSTSLVLHQTISTHLLQPLYQPYTQYAPLLPAYNPALIAELSHHYLRVYSGFWCCPKPDIVAAAEYIIMNHLGGAGLTYSSVHKRSMEGGCSKVHTLTHILYNCQRHWH